MSSAILTYNEIMEKAPAVFETDPAVTMHSKYKIIKTSDLIEPLMDEGWNVVSASQRRTRKEEWQDKTFHFLRFRNDGFNIGNDPLEIVVSNSHNGSSSFKIQLGVFRVVCSNGLIAGTDLVSPLMLQHKGLSNTLITEIATMYANKMSTYLTDGIEAMKKTEISDVAMFELANYIAKQKHADYEVDVNGMLHARRMEDYGQSVWTIYNRLQENMIKGGYQIKGENGKWRQARAISSPMADIELNTKLFDKALEYAA